MYKIGKLLKNLGQKATGNIIFSVKFYIINLIFVFIKKNFNFYYFE